MFRFHQQGGQDGNQGQESRDHKEVLEHGDAGSYQRGLGLLEIRSKIHVGGQAVERSIPQADKGCQPQSHPHHSRCCDQCGRGSPLVTRRRAQSANAYRRDDQPKSQPVKGGEKSGQVAE